jgi:hypothetical protein
MIVRRLGVADCCKVWKLAREYIVGMYESNGFPVDEGKMMYGLKDFVPWSYGLEREGELVGVLGGTVTSVYLLQDLMWCEALFFVDRKYRGHVASFLKQVQEDLRSRDVKHMTLALAGNSKRLRFLYKRFGYKFLDANYIKSL